MPLPVRVGIVCLIAAMVAGQINRGIYRLAWTPRSIGPWSPPAPNAPTRRWTDRLPVLGWLGLSRESALHGPSFWHRPFLIELCFIVGMALLYVHECNQGFYPAGAAATPTSTIHFQFGAHFVLIALMLVATFIDIDEKTIPDEITVPGTIIGLLLATCLPTSLPPVWNPIAAIPVPTETLNAASPLKWPTEFNGINGLLLAQFCIAMWVYGLIPKLTWYRGGFIKFWKYLSASIARHKQTKWYVVGWVILALFVFFIWSVGGVRWTALLTSILGLAGGGAIVWGVRVFAGVALQKEAMGFGDVTLMAMIGAFLGWQAALLIFFLAPFTGSLTAIVQWIVTGRKDIPYGPFLASAALVCLVTWPYMWRQIDTITMMFATFAELFDVPVGQFMFGAFGGFFVLVALSLAIVNLLKRLFGLA